MQNGDILTRVEKTPFYIIFELPQVDLKKFEVQELENGIFLVK